MHGKNLQKLMRQAPQTQEQIGNEMGELRVEASSGGGMVSVTMDETKQLLSVTVNPEAVDQTDLEMLQDLVLAAGNEAVRVKLTKPRKTEWAASHNAYCGRTEGE